MIVIIDNRRLYSRNDLFVNVRSGRLSPIVCVEFPKFCKVAQKYTLSEKSFKIFWKKLFPLRI